MAIDFPASPSVGQIFTSGGFSWRWDGTRWVSAGAVPTIASPNKFHNGFLWFDQQREGASVAIAAGGQQPYGADGVKCGSNSTRVTSGSVQRVQAGAAANFPYAVAHTLTVSAGGPATATDWLQIFDWALEGGVMVDAFWPGALALPLTLSFWFATDTAGTYSLGFRGAGGTPYRSYLIDFAAPGDSTYHLYSFTIPPDTNSAWYAAQFLTTGAVEIDISAGAGSTFVAPSAGTWLTNNYVQGPGNTNPGFGAGTHNWWLGPHKLEVGTQATPMAMGSVSETLLRCQRYYEKNYDIGQAPGSAVGTSKGGSRIYVNGAITAGGMSPVFKVAKRAIPTVTLYSPGSGASGVIYSYTNTPSDVSASMDSTNTTSFFYYAASTTYLNCSAMWTADARL
jgi:hypothetical protein